MKVKLIESNGSRGNPGLSGGGGLVWDRHGHFIFGYSCFFGNLTSLHVELKAMLFGVRQCLLCGYDALHVETDSLVLANMIQGTSACPWELQGELEELLQYRHSFQAISHCYKEANKPVDQLANSGVDLQETCTYDSLASLPGMVRGDVRLDSLGYPNFRTRIY